MIEELQGFDLNRVISHFRMRNKPFDPEWFLDYYCGYDPSATIYKCFFDFKQEIWNFIFKTFVERITSGKKYSWNECYELIELLIDNCDYPMECDGFTTDELDDLVYRFYTYIGDIVQREISLWSESKDDPITALCLALSFSFDDMKKNK